MLFRVLGSGFRVQSCLGFRAQLVPHQPTKNLLGVSRAWRFHIVASGFSIPMAKKMETTISVE